MTKPKETKAERRERWVTALENVTFPEDSYPIVKKALDEYSGDFTVLESAIGAYFLGMMIGWKPLVIVHSPKTIKRYEKILNISFKDAMPIENGLSDRSNGYSFAIKLSNFWAATTGNASVEGRKVAIGLDGQTE
jgi:hypothetical protein